MAEDKKQEPPKANVLVDRDIQTIEKKSTEKLSRDGEKKGE